MKHTISGFDFLKTENPFSKKKDKKLTESSSRETIRQEFWEAAVLSIQVKRGSNRSQTLKRTM
jgi:hypothetical protein